MTATILWVAFMALLALFVLAVIVKGVTRLLRGRTAASRHPFSEAGKADERRTPGAGRGG